MRLACRRGSAIAFRAARPEMSRLQRKSLQRPDEQRPLGRGRLELVDLGDVAVGRVTYPPGWRWSTDVQPLVHTSSCEVHHIGFVVSGRLRVEMTDGSTLDLEADDAFEIPPGHDAWVVGDEPWVAVDSLGRRYFGAVDGDVGHRALGSILFTDIVGSTETAARVGDVAWHALLADLNSSARQDLERHHGREIDTTDCSRSSMLRHWRYDAGTRWWRPRGPSG